MSEVVFDPFMAEALRIEQLLKELCPSEERYNKLVAILVATAQEQGYSLEKTLRFVVKVWWGTLEATAEHERPHKV